MLYIADGEFGEETIEAETINDAARAIAEKHAGLEYDEVCQEVWWFSVRNEIEPDYSVEFQVEWNPVDGLEVYNHQTGELL